MDDDYEVDDSLIESGMFYGHQVIRRAKYDELQAKAERLRSALDDCRTAPFETVDQIRAYARLALEEKE